MRGEFKFPALIWKRLDKEAAHARASLVFWATEGEWEKRRDPAAKRLEWMVGRPTPAPHEAMVVMARTYFTSRACEEDFPSASATNLKMNDNSNPVLRNFSQ